MATYSNPHWLLSHIRNSFISTDDTGMCETVMASDDLPKYYLNRFQGNGTTRNMQQQQRRSLGSNQVSRNLDPPLQEIDFVCYPGLDESDDEDIDLTTQSFDIQMYPEVGAHRFRSNTAQKLEKMDIARRKAARTKCVSFLDEVVPPVNSNFFQRKPVSQQKQSAGNSCDKEVVKSKLSVQLANSTQQPQSKFQEYAKFDGTSQTGMHIQRINVFLNMLPENERNYPIKICVMGSATIEEVIGFICYKASIQFPNLPLKSVRHYGLYMTEDNEDLVDFPPLDNREPCSKFGFSHLTLAELKTLSPPTTARIETDHSNGPPSKSMALEEEKTRLAAAKAVNSLSFTEFPPLDDVDDVDSSRVNNAEAECHVDDFEQHILTQDDMLEAPAYRTFNLHIIDKRFFRSEVTLGISGERMEIDQHKHNKFWTKQRAVTYPLEAVAHCEIVERRTMKAILRIWLRTASSLITSTHDPKNSNTYTPSSPTSPGHYHPSLSSPFSFLSTSQTNSYGFHHHQHQPQIRFKHYDFETTLPMAEQINKKLNCVLEMHSSQVRREFLQNRAQKLEKSLSKKQFKL